MGVISLRLNLVEKALNLAVTLALLEAIFHLVGQKLAILSTKRNVASSIKPTQD
jgi:hypothetical protein